MKKLEELKSSSNFLGKSRRKQKRTLDRGAKVSYNKPYIIMATMYT